ncbi:MAG: HD-GYP domain-containing protein [Huintestinicola sp.]
MLYLKTSELTPGMCLARDINFFDASVNTVIRLKFGQRLTDVYITQMRKADVDGAYIDCEHSETRIISSINSEIKSDAINNIHTLAEHFIDSSKGVEQSDVDKIGNTTEKLIDELAGKKDILINIADIKMYDDYTFHHSLSVAIMAIAIGLELGMSRTEIYELGVAGLLHDIGKVSIPIEIINKKGRLTEEEFDTVKMHPVYAATHLRERKLVSENCYFGIIAHHEKYDGSGYPFKLAGEKIPYFARILAVADVYDALTSQRPYRTPSPPNEAIEYIMGGTGTHFDEDIVRAFLRKVAPYPVGSGVYLSNGKEAVVMKNFPDQPLRPIVSLKDSEKVINLRNDETSLNIVITGLIEDNGMKLINT